MSNIGALKPKIDELQSQFSGNDDDFFKYVKKKSENVNLLKT